MPYVILGAVAFLAALTLITSYVCFRIALGGGKYLTDPYVGVDKESFAPYRALTVKNIDRITAAPFEEVSITAEDGVKLVGNYYHSGDGAPLEIQFHGYRSMAYRDFSGGACEALDRGHNLLLVDQRAHGRSGGKALSFGALESHDCLSWARYAEERFGKDTKTLLVGLSMGAATVLIASALDLPQSVCGIIADCPCSSGEEIIRMVAKKRGYPIWLLMPFLRLGARLFGGFSLKDSDVLRAVPKSRVPILLIHGESDDFVPCEMSEKIKAANERIVFETFPGATHGLSYVTDPNRYRNISDNFMKEVLK